VVYCQMHYAVDSLAGLAVAGLVTWLAGTQKSVSGKAKRVSGD
jgi:membrane-associated phospholipid phosphatase